MDIVSKLEEKGANLKSLKETWIDTTTPEGQLMFTIFSGLSQFERDLISQRTKEGLEVAKAKGKHIGRKATKTSQIEYAMHLVDTGQMNVTEASKHINVSRMTLHRYMKKREESAE